MGLEQAWYKQSSWLKLLRPFELLFRKLSANRKQQFLTGKRAIWQAPVPVIVVGNITVGGTGKSPLVVWLIDLLRQQGYNPGVISRGYGAKPDKFPFIVDSHSDVSLSGDEPLMIARRAGVPVVIDPDRVAAAKHLLDHFDCDLIISDDGLQHYPLGRSIEIAVVDGRRGFGNQRCLPEGPLREPVERLEEVDFIVINRTDSEQASLGLSSSMNTKAYGMRLGPVGFVSLKDKQQVPLGEWCLGHQFNAVAGIGHPERFYRTMNEIGFELNSRSFPDHHQFTLEDLHFSEHRPLVMTEKDAVKCDHMQLDNAWYLRVAAQPDNGFAQQLLDRLTTLSPAGGVSKKGTNNG